jgi:membrane protein
MPTRFHRIYLDLAQGRVGAGRTGVAALTELLHMVVVLLREAGRDRIAMRAAMLSYWTAVAIVPILLIGLTLSAPLGGGTKGRDAIMRLLYDTILTESVEDVGAALDVLLSGANLTTVGVFGILGLMITGSQLYFNVEQAYNDIFKTRVRRNLLLRFTLFYSGITLGPSLIAAGFLVTASLPAQFGALDRALPVLLTSVAFVAAIRLLPDRRVSWRAAFVGGLLSAMLFELAKMGFSTYMRAMGTAEGMAGIYGSLAFLPVFLIWLQIIWMVVLLGVEVAWLVESYAQLVGNQRRDSQDPHSSLRHADADFGLALVEVLGPAFLRGEEALSLDELVSRMRSDPRHIQTSLDVLVAAGLVLETEDHRYAMARPPDQLEPNEIRARYRAFGAPIGPPPDKTSRPDSGAV